MTRTDGSEREQQIANMQEYRREPEAGGETDTRERERDEGERDQKSIDLSEKTLPLVFLELLLLGSMSLLEEFLLCIMSSIQRHQEK